MENLHENLVAVGIFLNGPEVDNTHLQNEQSVHYKLIEYEIQENFHLSVLTCWKCAILCKLIHRPLILVDWAVFPTFQDFTKMWTKTLFFLLKYISEKSSPKGSFWRNKWWPEFSDLSGRILYIYRQWLLIIPCWRVTGMHAISFVKVHLFSMLYLLIS